MQDFWSAQGPFCHLFCHTLLPFGHKTILTVRLHLAVALVGLPCLPQLCETTCSAQEHFCWFLLTSCSENLRLCLNPNQKVWKWCSYSASWWMRKTIGVYTSWVCPWGPEQATIFPSIVLLETCLCIEFCEGHSCLTRRVPPCCQLAQSWFHGKHCLSFNIWEPKDLPDDAWCS